MLRRKQVKTRIHSSGIRTARFDGHLYRGGCLAGGVSAQEVSVWGVSTQWGVHPWTQRQTPPKPTG